MAIAGVALALAAAPVHAAPLDDNAWKEIAVRLAASATDARGDRPEDALRMCNEARSYAARYDQDALIQGKIEICFGVAALFRKDRSAACAAYGRALPLLTSAEPGDAMLDLDRAKRSHRELGC
jgi:hypothetical protein